MLIRCPQCGGSFVLMFRALVSGFSCARCATHGIGNQLTAFEEQVLGEVALGRAVMRSERHAR